MIISRMTEGFEHGSCRRDCKHYCRHRAFGGIGDEEEDSDEFLSGSVEFLLFKYVVEIQYYIDSIQ